jgi:hypothetical protein
MAYLAQSPQPTYQDSAEAVVVNVAVCHELADWLRSREIPEDREDSSLQSFTREEVGNFYLLLVAICHQTSPRGKLPLEGTVQSKHLRGWDYLSAKLEEAARFQPALLTPAVWASFTADKVLELFRDPMLGDRLSEPERRAQLIRDLGQKMLRHSWQCAEHLYKSAAARIATCSNNLLDLLATFRAYDDPVRKKSSFFLALMRNAGLWSYADPEKLGAPVDYHEVRGHLRIGTVQVHDPDLRAILVAGGEVTPAQDISVRRAVHSAIMLLSEQSGLRNPSQLHYLFWNVFRSCCTRESPHCYSCPTSCTLQSRYVPLAMHPEGVRRCPFSSVCESVGREPKLLDYRLETDYY